LGTADLFFQLRAERLQAGDGRIYTATYTATDGSDNETSDSDQVQVPKSKKP
jgi:endo-1,4-beta-xylanase